VGPRLAPAGLGFITLFFGIGQAAAPAVGGYLADVSGSFTLPFLVAGGISLAGMVTSLFLKKPSHHG
jgi:MFS family permease